MNQITSAQAIIFSLASLFQSRCWLCQDKCREGKYFVIHHRKYKDGEKIYSDFPNRYEYMKYLEPIVRKEPERFRLLHSRCHVAVERLRRYKPANRKRLVILANE